MSEVTYPTVTTWMQAIDGYQVCLQACMGWQEELARFTDLSSPATAAPGKR